jgi:hypothetical protein
MGQFDRPDGACNPQLGHQKLGRDGGMFSRRDGRQDHDCIVQGAQAKPHGAGPDVQIHTQLVELEPMPGEDLGRLDLAFVPLIPREDIYFCLESKRLNVLKDGQPRAYALQYVKSGMLRFVAGQYSKAVRHGGMLAYVLDGNIVRAISNVEENIRKQRCVLCMSSPGALLPSMALVNDPRARETHHQRDHEASVFGIHLFMANRGLKMAS